jgi:hypothetical protein
VLELRAKAEEADRSGRAGFAAEEVAMPARTPRRATLGWIAAAALCLLVAPHTAGAEEARDIAGIYEINGETTVQGSPDRFAITGKLVLRQKGSDCNAIVEAEMRRTAGTSGPASAALIGNGELKLTGDKLQGKAELQSLVSEVAELDVDVNFAPRVAGPVLDATATGEVLEDGSLKLEIRSTLHGEGFTLPEGRRTIVVAKRVARHPAELKKK